MKLIGVVPRCKYIFYTYYARQTISVADDMISSITQRADVRELRVKGLNNREVIMQPSKGRLHSEA